MRKHTHTHTHHIHTLYRHAKLAAFASKDASKDQEIEHLKKRLAATENQLAEEMRKEEELEANLKKTKADLEKDEKDLAEDKKVIVKQDAEIEDLRKQVEIRTRSAEQLRSTLRGADAVAGSLVAQTSQAVEACAASVLDLNKYRASAKRRARGLERANAFLREGVQDMRTRVEPLVAMTQENARGMAEIVSDLQGNFAHQEQELKQSALSRCRLGEVHELVMLLVRDLAVAEILMEQCKMEAVVGLVVLERWGGEEQALRETLSERLGAEQALKETLSERLREQLADCRQRQLAAEESEGELHVAYQRLLTTHREIQGTLECKIKELAALDRTQNNLSWKHAQLEEAYATLQHRNSDLKQQYATTTNQLCNRVLVLEQGREEEEVQRRALLDRIEDLEREKMENDLQHASSLLDAQNVMEALEREQDKYENLKRERDGLIELAELRTEQLQTANEMYHMSQTELQTALSRIHQLSKLQRDASSLQLENTPLPPPPQPLLRISPVHTLHSSSSPPPSPACLSPSPLSRLSLSAREGAKAAVPSSPRARDREIEKVPSEIERVPSRSVPLEAATQPPTPSLESLPGWALLASARAMRKMIEAEEKVRPVCIYVYMCTRVNTCVYTYMCVYTFTCIDGYT